MIQAGPPTHLGAIVLLAAVGVGFIVVCVPLMLACSAVRYVRCPTYMEMVETPDGEDAGMVEQRCTEVEAQ